MSKKPIVRPTYVIESVDRALRLLQAIRDQGGMRLTEAAAELGCAESTAHRILAMLVYHGFVEQDDHRRYVPGSSMGVAPAPASGTRTLRDLCLPAMRAVAAEIDETVNVVVRDGVRARVVGTVESTRLLRAGNRQGHVPLARHAGGGKALLAELNDTELAELYTGGEDPLTPEALGALEAELDAVRARGYAVAMDAVEQGLTAMARTLHGPDGTAVAALVVALPTARLKERMAQGLVASMSAAAVVIESTLASSSWVSSS